MFILIFLLVFILFVPVGLVVVYNLLRVIFFSLSFGFLADFENDIVFMIILR